MVPSTSYARLAYSEFGSPREMSDDARAAGDQLRLPKLEHAAHAAVQAPPSIRFEDFPSEISKREIRVSDATARLASALHLHLD